MFKFSKLIKTTIVILIIILTVAVVGILVYIINRNKAIKIDESNYVITFNPNSEIQEVFLRSDYYIVKTCVNKFYTYYSSIHDEMQGSSKNPNIDVIYNMLDEEYITNKEITIDNLTTKLTTKWIETEKMLISIDDMYVTLSDETISAYFVYGKLIDTSTGELYDFSLMVKVDIINKSFTILPSDYIEEKYQKIEIGSKIEVDYPDEIKPNKYNRFTYETISDETYAKDLFRAIRMKMMYDETEMFERLDQEYKLRRFPTIEKFKEYIKNNYRNIVTMKLTKYQKNQNDNDVQYILGDEDDRYYIINETSIMKGTIILDTYTIDLPQFITKYEESDNKDKVALNIEKLKEAINGQDYEYVYNKLDETYRANNFPDITDFKKYINNNFFEKNTFKYENIEEKAGVYVATINVKNKDNVAENKEVKIIVKLNEGTDFIMSFALAE